LESTAPIHAGKYFHKPEILPEVIPAAETTTADSDVLAIIDEEIPVITVSQPLRKSATPEIEQIAKEGNYLSKNC